MTGAPDVIPRDDRAWPRGSVVVSVVLGLVAVGIGAGLAVDAAARGGLLMAAVLAGFLVTFGLAAAVYVVGVRRWLLGRPFPSGLQFASLGLLAVAFVVLVVVDEAVGFAMLAAVIGGLAIANVWAIRVARRNRARVDEVEAVTAENRETSAGAASDARAYRRERATRSVPVAPALRNAIALERRRVLAWLIAGVVVAAACVALDAPGPVVFGVVAVAGLAPVWVLRRLWAIWLALRDFRKAAPAPRRAFVVLLHDPAPRMMRPLLGVWSEPPIVREGHLPAPERVYRCDEEHDALECYQGSVVVHEAWVDTGPRPASRPRWVVADAGIALPHRRSVFGRWYLGNLIRGERPEPPEPLTARPPHAVDEVIVERGDDVGGSFAAALGSRVAQLAAVALLLYWLI